MSPICKLSYIDCFLLGAGACLALGAGHYLRAIGAFWDVGVEGVSIRVGSPINPVISGIHVSVIPQTYDENTILNTFLLVHYHESKKELLRRLQLLCSKNASMILRQRCIRAFQASRHCRSPWIPRLQKIMKALNPESPVWLH